MTLPRHLPPVLCLVLLGLFGPAACGGDTDNHGHDTASDPHDEHDEHDEQDGHDEHDEHDEQDEQDEQDGHDEHGEEGEVHLTPVQVEAAGIRVQAAGPGTVERTLRLTASVIENGDREMHVTARVAGLIQEIHAGLGEVVTAGQPLCTFESVEIGRTVADYRAATARVDAAARALDAERALYEKRIATATRLAGAQIALARRIFEREQGLEERGVSTRRALLDAETHLREKELQNEADLAALDAERATRLRRLDTDLVTARIEHRSSRDAVRILGLDPETALDSADSPDRVIIRSPGDGVVGSRHATRDESVEAGAVLFEIHDPSVAWVEAAVYEKDLRFVRRGQSVRLSVRALPDTAFEGRIARVGFDLDRRSRSVPIVIAIPNEPVAAWSEPWPLRPGMFAHAEVVIGETPAAIAVPESAVVHEGDRAFLFVRTGDGVFERRAVRIGAATTAAVEIVAGVEVGEAIVIEGTFTLKSAARAGELGGGHNH